MDTSVLYISPPIDDLADLNSVINTILPLDLYKYSLFPAEQAFDDLSSLLEQLVPVSGASSPTTITGSVLVTPAFLFSVCDVICATSETNVAIEKVSILPAVLRRLRAWRVLTCDDRSFELTKLAVDIAGLVHSPPNLAFDALKLPIGSSAVRTVSLPDAVAVPVSSASRGGSGQVTLSRTEVAQAVSLKNLASVSGTNLKSGIPPDPRAQPLSRPRVKENPCTAWRRGCCACRLPRVLQDPTRASEADTAQSNVLSERHVPQPLVRQAPVSESARDGDPVSQAPRTLNQKGRRRRQTSARFSRAAIDKTISSPVLAAKTPLNYMQIVSSVPQLGTSAVSVQKLTQTKSCKAQADGSGRATGSSMKGQMRTETKENNPLGSAIPFSTHIPHGRKPRNVNNFHRLSQGIVSSAPKGEK